jgi:hypothetical protein
MGIVLFLNAVEEIRKKTQAKYLIIESFKE